MVMEAGIKKSAGADGKAAGDGFCLSLSWAQAARCGLQRFLGHYIFSSLTRRILFLNLAALCVLVVGILYLNQFRDGLIEARVESLMTQGEIIAGAIAASATVETDSIIDRSREAAGAAGRRKPRAGLRPARQPRFPDQSRARGAGAATADLADRTRARIYDRDANLLLDSRHLYSRGQILRYDLPPVDEEELGPLRPASRSSSPTSSAAPTCRSTRSSPAATARPFPRS